MRKQLFRLRIPVVENSNVDSSRDPIAERATLLMSGKGRGEELSNTLCAATHCHLHAGFGIWIPNPK